MRSIYLKAEVAIIERERTEQIGWISDWRKFIRGSQGDVWIQIVGPKKVSERK